VKSDDRLDVGARPRDLERHRPAEAIADAGHPIGVGHPLVEQHVEACQAASAGGRRVVDPGGASRRTGVLNRCRQHETMRSPAWNRAFGWLTRVITLWLQVDESRGKPAMGSVHEGLLHGCFGEPGAREPAHREVSTGSEKRAQSWRTASSSPAAKRCASSRSEAAPAGPNAILHQR
jgi:hypothetical protein